MKKRERCLAAGYAGSEGISDFRLRLTGLADDLAAFTSSNLRHIAALSAVGTDYHDEKVTPIPASALIESMSHQLREVGAGLELLLAHGVIAQPFEAAQGGDNGCA